MIVNAATGEKVTTTGTHPVAELFPMLAGDDLQALRDDIAAQGVLTPVVLDTDGVLLDGRNRVAAAKLAKVDVPCTVYEGEPVAFILGANMARRDMSKGQKAMVTAQAILATNTEQALAAKSVGVSQPSVSQATTVLTHAPELADQVVAGKRTLDDAYKVARANKAAAAKSEQILADLEEHAPDLAEKVAAGDLELAEAKLLHDRRVKEAEQAAQDRSRLFAECVVKLGATLDVGDPIESVEQLIAEWRPDAVRITDTNDWLTAEGLNRVARCLVLTAERWDQAK